MDDLSRPSLAIEGDPAFSEWTCHEDIRKHGRSVVERLDCESGFSVVRSRVSSARVLTEACQHEGTERLLVIAFGLAGNSEFHDQRGKCLSFAAGQTTVSVFQQGRGERSYPANEPVQQLRLVVSESALMRYIGLERCRQVLGMTLARHESFRQIAFHGSHTSEHLRFFRTPGVARQDGLSQRIHALSLLAEQLKILAPPAERAERLKGRDMDNLEHVEAYMRAHLDKPLNNAYLCTALGISEYKLKECFRQAYGTSPAQHLIEMRMHRAREMLAAGYQVSETAYRVGYQHPSNLSSAFTRFFGCTPKSVRGKRE